MYKYNHVTKIKKPSFQDIIDHNTNSLGIIDWESISKIKNLSTKFIRKYKDKVDWKIICRFQKLNDKFILKYFYELPQPELLSYQKLSENIIERVLQQISSYYKNIGFSDETYTILCNQKLSEDMIRKYMYIFKDYLNIVFSRQHVSEAFIEEFVFVKDNSSWIKDNWRNISYYQILSESFIEKHKDNVDWNNIAARQKLSLSFIKKHLDRFDASNLLSNYKLSKYTIEKVKNIIIVF